MQKHPQTRRNSWSKTTRIKRGPLRAPFGADSSSPAWKPHSKSAASSAASAAAEAAVIASSEAITTAAVAAVRASPPSSAAAGQQDRALRFFETPFRRTDVHVPRRNQACGLISSPHWRALPRRFYFAAQNKNVCRASITARSASSAAIKAYSLTVINFYCGLSHFWDQKCLFLDPSDPKTGQKPPSICD